MGKVIDSLTGVEFDSYQEYLDHVSPVTGFKPSDPEHQGKRGLLVSKKALARTGSLSKEVEAEIESKLEVVRTSLVQEKLADQRAVAITKMITDRPLTKSINLAEAEAKR